MSRQQRTKSFYFLWSLCFGKILTSLWKSLFCAFKMGNGASIRGGSGQVAPSLSAPSTAKNRPASQTQSSPLDGVISRNKQTETIVTPFSAAENENPTSEHTTKTSEHSTKTSEQSNSVCVEETNSLQQQLNHLNPTIQVGLRSHHRWSWYRSHYRWSWYRSHHRWSCLADHAIMTTIAITITRLRF